MFLLVLGELPEVHKSQCLYHVRYPRKKLSLQRHRRFQLADAQHAARDRVRQDDRFPVLPFEASDLAGNGSHNVHLSHE